MNIELNAEQAAKLLGIYNAPRKGNFSSSSVNWMGSFTWGGDTGPYVFGSYIRSEAETEFVEIHIGWEEIDGMDDSLPGDSYSFQAYSSEVHNWATAARAAKAELQRIIDEEC